MVCNAFNVKETPIEMETKLRFSLRLSLDLPYQEWPTHALFNQI